MYHVKILKDKLVVREFLSPHPLTPDEERQLLQNMEGHWIDIARVPIQPEDLIPEKEFYESDYDECAR